MEGVELIQTIKLFGFKEGFKFWFRWSISDPIKIFYWKYIIGKPLCTYHGHFLCENNCKYPKIYGRKNIINYEKERHKEIEKQSRTIRKGKNDLCVYCDEEKGTELIDDPNWDTLERWKVCKTCKEMINHQRDYSFGKRLTDNKSFGIRNLGLEISKKAGDDIKRIEKETGKKSFTCGLNIINKEV